MAPPVPTFHLSSLSSEINTLPHGKTQSPPIDLESLPLKELVQYRCDISESKGKGQPTIVCLPVVRFYRACKDGTMIETTAWEGWKRRQASSQLNAEGR